MVFIGLVSAAASEALIRMGWTGSPSVQFMVSALEALLMQLRYLALNLAPLADDVCFTRCILVMEQAISLLTVVTRFESFGIRHAMDVPEAVDHIRSAVLLANILWTVFLVCGLIVAMFQRGAQRMQRIMWMALSLCLWLRVVSLTAGCVALLTFGQFDHIGTLVGLCLIWITANLLTICLIARPHLGQAVHARLGRVFAAHSAARAAAGLACLMRGGSTRMILEEARRRFRVVSLASVTFEDIKTNQPDPSLFSKTMASQLGHCDAFVSHSWHDNASAKWAALQSWREAFVRQHGHEPSVWFDKFCIDQQDIDANLRSLPIFLSGCEKLLIVYGPTYLERLWCVLEVFTFVHIGGSWDRVELLPVLRSRYLDGDEADVEATIQQFSVEDCKCFLQEDKECMIMIILTAYGSLDAFGKAVRSMFSKDSMCKYSSDTDESATCEVAVNFAGSGTSESSDVACLDGSESSEVH